jgi:hypothetical protein
METPGQAPAQPVAAPPMYRLRSMAAEQGSDGGVLGLRFSGAVEEVASVPVDELSGRLSLACAFPNPKDHPLLALGTLQVCCCWAAAPTPLAPPQRPKPLAPPQRPRAPPSRPAPTPAPWLHVRPLLVISSPAAAARLITCSCAGWHGMAGWHGRRRSSAGRVAGSTAPSRSSARTRPACAAARGGSAAGRRRASPPSAGSASTPR